MARELPYAMGATIKKKRKKMHDNSVLDYLFILFCLILVAELRKIFEPKKEKLSEMKR